MAPSELYIAFVLAVAILMLIPGPNVALIVANSVARGPRYGLATVAGTSAAMVVQLGFTVAGLEGLLHALSGGFEVLRWLGVAYLIYLGITAWRAPAVDLCVAQSDSPSVRRTFIDGFIVSMCNPKTLMFYAAFLPQFVDASQPRLVQLLLLAATFLAVAVVVDGCWALLAGRARRLLAQNGAALKKLSGGFYLTAAAGLDRKKAR